MMPAAVHALRPAWRIAVRELRGGLSGFRVFLLCLALGVGAIAGVGSLSQAILGALTDNGRSLLGGDLEVRLAGYRADTGLRATFGKGGTLSEIATLRAMARTSAKASASASLVEVKAVDGAYPLYGAVTITSGAPAMATLEQRGGRFGALVEQALLDRLGLDIGGALKLGQANLEVRGVIAREPDRAAAGFIVGPRVLISRAALEASGLVQPGSLVNWRYRIRLADGNAGDREVEQFRKNLTDAYPDAGWHIKTRANAAPGLKRFVERLSMFLTLLGFTALVVGGLGIGNAVKAYLGRKTATIATLKCLGASGRTIFTSYLFQVWLLAGLGIGVGLAIGAAVPLVLATAAGGVLPVDVRSGVYFEPLLLATAAGFIIATLFALWPLARARDTAPAALYRDNLVPARRWPRAPYTAAIVLTAASLLAVMVLLADDRRIAFIYGAGVFGALVLLAALAAVLSWCAARVPHSANMALRLAVSNLHRPGNAVASMVVSLGTGLSLVVALALIDNNIARELERTLSSRAPSFFFVDIKPDQVDAFEKMARAVPGIRTIERVAMLRGRITRLNGVDVAKITPPHNIAWALHGDRGVTYSSDLPANSTLIAGTWWPGDYDGPPLVSMVDEIATGLGLKPGDTITTSILGRSITARIANLRSVNWGSLTINFVLVYSPNTLRDAPHMNLATVSIARDRELALQNAVAEQFPNVTAVRVRDAVAVVTDLMGKLLISLRAATGVALLAAVLVLAGAVAAGHRARLYDAAVLRALGARRAMLLRTYALEYLVLGAATAAFSLIAGGLAGYAVVVHVLNFDWAFAAETAVVALAIALPLTIGLGLAGSWRILGRKPAPTLRAAQ